LLFIAFDIFLKWDMGAIKLAVYMARYSVHIFIVCYIIT
jgi:hypothetical protein